jgi:hypothetical protein
MLKNNGSGNDGCGKNNIIYMELYSGPKMEHSKYEKTNVVGSIDRDSTVFPIRCVCIAADDECNRSVHLLLYKCGMIHELLDIFLINSIQRGYNSSNLTKCG